MLSVVAVPGVMVLDPVRSRAANKVAFCGRVEMPLSKRADAPDGSFVIEADPCEFNQWQRSVSAYVEVPGGTLVDDGAEFKNQILTALRNGEILPGDEYTAQAAGVPYKVASASPPAATPTSDTAAL